MELEQGQRAAIAPILDQRATQFADATADADIRIVDQPALWLREGIGFRRL